MLWNARLHSGVERVACGGLKIRLNFLELFPKRKWLRMIDVAMRAKRGRVVAKGNKLKC